MRYLRLRLLMLFVAAWSWTAGREFFSVQAGRGALRETAGWAICFLATAMSGILACGAIARRRWVDHFATWIKSLPVIRPIIPHSDSASCPRAFGGILGLALVCTFVLVISHRFPQQAQIEGTDQSAYLESAQRIHDSGGVLQFVADLYSGRFAEANRHPLYLMFLGAHPTILSGKLLSVGFTSLLLIVHVVLCVRRFGWPNACICGTLLATNLGLTDSAITIGCESLLALVVSAAWWVAASQFAPNCRRQLTGQGCCVVPPRGQAVSTSRDALGMPQRAPATEGPLAPGMASEGFGQLPAALLGALLGLAYLCKGTGLLFLIGATVWLWFAARPGGRSQAAGPLQQQQEHATRSTQAESAEITPRWQHFWNHNGLAVLWLLLSWGVICSPLLARNVLRYGAPTYNVNSWLLFQDTFVDPEPLAAAMPLREAAWHYLQTHTSIEIIDREMRGLVWEVFMLCRVIGPVAGGNAGILCGAGLLLAAGMGLSSASQAARQFLGAWVIPHLLLFAWYVPIAAGDRFLLPLVPILLTYSAMGISSFWGRLAERVRLPVLAAGCICWMLIAVMMT